MLDKTIEEFAGAFINRVREVKDNSFMYTMDESVQSLTLLDLYFDRNLYTANAEQLLQDIVLASAYIGVVAYKNFRKNDLQARLTYTSKENSDTQSVLLSIENKDKTEACRIDLSNTLLKTITSAEVTHFSRLYKIPLGLTDKKIWYSCLGVLTLLHQDYEIPSSLTLEDINIHIVQLCQNIAFDYSSRYTTIVPEKHKIFSPDIFSIDLIFPPPGIEERAWHQSSLLRFHSLKKEGKVSIEDILELSSYLIESSNIHHSTFAAALLTSFKNKSEIAIVAELLHNFPILSFHLLPSIEANINIEGITFKIEDLTKHFISESIEIDNTKIQTNEKSVQFEIFENMTEMGVFPLLCCPQIQVAGDQKYSFYFETLMKGYIAESYALGISLQRSYEKLAPSVLLQHAWILTQHNKLDEARAFLNNLKERFTDEEFWTLHSLKFIIDHKNKNKTKEGLHLIEQGLNINLFPGHKKIKKILCEIVSNSIEKTLLENFFLLMSKDESIYSSKSIFLLKNRFPDEEIAIPRHVRRSYWSPYRFYLPNAV